MNQPVEAGWRRDGGGVVRRNPLPLQAAFLLFCLLLIASFTVAVAADRYVDDAACPGPGSGTDPDPYCSIQDAMCELDGIGGGTVHVRPGYYNESLRMFPGVSVISTGGASVSTIDATGRPWTRSDCEPSTSNLTCSTIVYGSGATNADRLEGFRITGGGGLFRSFPDGDPPTAVVGGGVFIFNGSPTITNNEISSNTLTSNGTVYYWGAGIYIGGGEYLNPTYPVITNNLIQENRAVPAYTNNLPEGIGGGIYVG